jgi:hypothetical protein
MKFLEQVTKTRERIQELKAELARVTAQPRSRQQVLEHVRESVRAIGPFAESENMLTLERLAAGQPANLLTVKASAMTTHGPVTVTVDLLPVMVRLLGVDAVHKALLTGVDGIDKGLPPTARKHQMQSIAASLDDLQTQEEHLIREAALDGCDIARRLDAEARFVLAQ